MSTYYSIQSKLSGNVIDIKGASKDSGAELTAYTQKTTGNDNQLWEFIPDPAGSGCFFIKSKLSGNVIDIQGASKDSGTPLDAYPQKTTGTDNQLWEFVPDPAGSGYSFIRSKLSGNVIDIKGASKDSGAELTAYTQKTTGYDNQLWKVVDGAFPGPKYTNISWGPSGTGPAPNSGTVGSDGNQCAYQMSLSIQQDGTCTFSGYYQNRGDVWWGTAPPQSFVVAFFVFDTSGKAYSFSYSGEIPSAPQAGSLVTWSKTAKCPVIADNWYGIAAKNWGSTWWYNSWSESVWQVLGEWVSDAASDFGQAVEDIVEAMADSSDGDGGDGGGDEDEIKKIPRPLPAGAPAGAVSTAHKAAAATAGQGK